ncbi:tetratricopeptide repeat protein [Corallococcus exiguus]|uniref:tetratricopeptide repeat protein n=1 Tax=Corallococcus exiguus TaxID=83462 RepID=UPI0014750560|nr:CDC27 family protein [Corallococcus exiguus]NNB97281.1 tetratricopeptide repeat protein [Corallococcus exiguus]
MTIGTEDSLTTLETNKPFSESVLWRAQRSYFERVGIDAWRDATVPHYVTCNPALAHAMAQVVLGFLRDCDAGESRAGSEPFHVLELGAGSGRFAFLFLRALSELREVMGWSHVPIRYVMSDFTESNLRFWRAHPALRPFVSAGLLDFALVDVERMDGTIELLESKTMLGAGSLERPLTVIANYVFDGVAQDAFFIEKGQLFECLFTVATDTPELDLSAANVLTRLRLASSRRAVHPDHYPEPEFNGLLRAYAGLLDEGSVLLPAPALRCLEKLSALARGRLFLLSADKGHLDEASLAREVEPQVTVHGSFSLPVNYHAFQQWFLLKGGELTCADHRQSSLVVAAFILGAPASGMTETRLAYHLAFNGPSPDDFFRLRQGIEAHYEALEFEQLLAHVRLSRYDARILGDCLPAFSQKVAALSAQERTELAQAIGRAWANYFHIGESRDLAFAFAACLYQLGEPASALALFEESLILYGEDPRTLWNLAMCLFALGRPEDAARSLVKAGESFPLLQEHIGLLPKTGSG